MDQFPDSVDDFH